MVLGRVAKKPLNVLRRVPTELSLGMLRQAAMAGGMAQRSCIFPVEISSHDLLRFLIAHDAGVRGVLKGLPSLINLKWQVERGCLGSGFL